MEDRSVCVSQRLSVAEMRPLQGSLPPHRTGPDLQSHVVMRTNTLAGSCGAREPKLGKQTVRAAGVVSDSVILVALDKVLFIKWEQCPRPCSWSFVKTKQDDANESDCKIR